MTPATDAEIAAIRQALADPTRELLVWPRAVVAALIARLERVEPQFAYRVRGVIWPHGDEARVRANVKQLREKGWDAEVLRRLAETWMTVDL